MWTYGSLNISIQKEQHFAVLGNTFKFNINFIFVFYKFLLLVQA